MVELDMANGSSSSVPAAVGPVDPQTGAGAPVSVRVCESVSLAASRDHVSR